MDYLREYITYFQRLRMYMSDLFNLFAVFQSPLLNI
jgi:hypothetical protein